MWFKFIFFYRSLFHPLLCLKICRRTWVLWPVVFHSLALADCILMIVFFCLLYFLQMVSESRGSIILKFNPVSNVLYVVLCSFIRRHILSGLPFGNFRSQLVLNSANSYVNISLVNLVFCSSLSIDFSGRTRGHTVLWVPDVDILFMPFYTWKAIFLDIKFLFYVSFSSSIMVVNFSVDLAGPLCPYIAKHCSGWFTFSGLW